MRTVFALLFVCLGASTASAATIEVTTPLDAVADDTLCSLREAILSANTDTAVGGCTAGDGADTIELPAGNFALAIEGQHEDQGQSGDLDVLDDLTLVGQNPEETVIDAAQIDRVLHIHAGVRATFENITITGGKAPNGAELEPGHHGGGILSLGTLHLTRCVLTDNEAGHGGDGVLTEDIFPSQEASKKQGGHGGALAALEGSVTIEASSICNNTAGRGGQSGLFLGFFDEITAGNGGHGGGVYATTPADISDTLLCNNSAGNGGLGTSAISERGGNGGAGGRGGALWSNHTAALLRTTLDNNTAGHGGDAGWSDMSGSGSGGNGGDGGGVFSDGGSLTLIASQAMDNQAGDGGDAPSNFWGMGPPGRGGHGGAVGLGAETHATLTTTSLTSNTAGTGGMAGAGSPFAEPTPHSPGGHGGALWIDAEASAQLERCAVLQNQAGGGVNAEETRVGVTTGGGHGGDGGGIYVSIGASLDALISTIANNQTGRGGDGGFHEECFTAGGNGGDGGGIANYGQSTLHNTTIFDNTASPAGITVDNGLCFAPIIPEPGEHGAGGGIFNQEGTATLRNTALASNQANAGPDCSGPLHSQDHNLLSQSAGCLLEGTWALSIVDEPAGLQPAADNGGPTLTCALSEESAALDQGPMDCGEIDQRGAARPQGPACDIGAFERGDGNPIDEPDAGMEDAQDDAMDDVDDGDVDELDAEEDTAEPDLPIPDDANDMDTAEPDDANEMDTTDEPDGADDVTEPEDTQESDAQDDADEPNDANDMNDAVEPDTVEPDAVDDTDAAEDVVEADDVQDTDPLEPDTDLADVPDEGDVSPDDVLDPGDTNPQEDTSTPPEDASPPQEDTSGEPDAVIPPDDVADMEPDIPQEDVEEDVSEEDDQPDVAIALPDSMGDDEPDEVQDMDNTDGEGSERRQGGGCSVTRGGQKTAPGWPQWAFWMVLGLGLRTVRRRRRRA